MDIFEKIINILNFKVFQLEDIAFTVHKLIIIALPTLIFFYSSRWIIKFTRKKELFIWKILGKSGRLVSLFFKILCILAGISIGFILAGIKTTIIQYSYKILFHPFATIGNSSVSIITIILLVITIYASVFLASYINNFIKSEVFNQSKLDEGIQDLIYKFTKYFIIVTGVLIGLQINGIDLSAFATIGAGLMVGLGFGLQNIANNFVSGIIILMERPIKIGDYVEMEGIAGEVLAIASRSTKIRNIQNIILIVPNSKLISENVINWSHNDKLVKLHINIGISYKSDPDKAKNILMHLAREHDSVLDDPAPDVLLTTFNESSIDLSLHIWIDNPLKRQKITSDINFLIYKRFKEQDIIIPFPQLDVHLHEEKNKNFNTVYK